MDPKKLLDAPKMVLILLAQIVYYTLTEAETFLVAATAVAVGWQQGWEWGIVLFIATYTAMRIIGGYIFLISSKLHLIAISNKRPEELNES